MGRDYAHEEWIPWYTRDTAAWLDLSLAARGAAEGIARKMGPHNSELPLCSRGLKGLARVLGCSWDELEPAMRELMAAGEEGEPPRLVYDRERNVLVDPQGNARRRKKSTERVQKHRALKADGGRSPDETRGNVSSVSQRFVTPGAFPSYSHSRSDLEDPSDRESPEENPSARATPMLPPPLSDELPDELPDDDSDEDAAERASGTRAVATPLPPAPSSPEADVARASATPAATGREPRPYHVRRAEQAHTKHAYESGIASVTGVACVVARAELSALDDAIDGHAPANTGEACDEWIRASAAAFARAIRGRERYHRSGSPRGWLEWLNQGSPTAEWLAMTPAQRDEHEAEQRRTELRKQRKKRDAERRAAEPPPEPPEAVTPEVLKAGAAGLFAAVANRVAPPLPENDADTGT